MDSEELAGALSGLWRWAQEHAPTPEPEIRRRLREHVGADPAELEVLSEDLSEYDHVNVQVALEALGGEPELIGLSLDRGFRVSLAELAGAGSKYGMVLQPGPPEYKPVDVGDRTISCLKSGLLLLDSGGVPLAALLAPREDEMGRGIRLQAISPRRAVAEAWLARLRELMREHNVYRGKVLSFGGADPFEPAPVSVRALPDVPRERIVLPARALERIERHTAGLARHRETLRASGRHVRRGLLLHGPPGTGKTLSVMYLAGLMPERTVILLTGRTVGAVGLACTLARSLEPAMVVIEDVDLIAQDRSHYESAPLLFELLDAMDGLDEDADLIFVLTTNRPETLETALASRPGRIDLAVELPLPDAAARRRLFDIYGAGLALEVPDWEQIVAATEGTSPAFIRELFRHAALTAAEDGREAVGAADLLGAVGELKDQSGRLTATLLGAERPLPLPPDLE
jgi:ATPase family associated with various cellular activities (AAA)